MIADTAELLARLEQINPDVIVIDRQPSRDHLEQMLQVIAVGGAARRDIRQSVDRSMSRAAVNASEPPRCPADLVEPVLLDEAAARPG